jgi:D-glycero-D-manno-heptose 1,7-bisphosphate phosphatase
MIGDSARDIECAHRAGCGRAILVKSADSRDAQQILAEKDLPPDYVAQDLYDAARWLIGTQF